MVLAAAEAEAARYIDWYVRDAQCVAAAKIESLLLAYQAAFAPERLSAAEKAILRRAIRRTYDYSAEAGRAASEAILVEYLARWVAYETEQARLGNSTEWDLAAIRRLHRRLEDRRAAFG